MPQLRQLLFSAHKLKGNCPVFLVLKQLHATNEAHKCRITFSLGKGSSSLYFIITLPIDYFSVLSPSSIPCYICITYQLHFASFFGRLS